jgi:4'-phosphopantetheinyl transferase
LRISAWNLDKREDQQEKLLIPDYRRWAAQELTKEMLDQKVTLEYDQQGKPHLKGFVMGCSVSHCRNKLVVGLNEVGPIGIDLEEVRPVVQRVKNKFLSDSELGRFPEMDKALLTLCWGVKESAYKWNGRKGLSLKRDIEIISGISGLNGHGKVRINTGKFFEELSFRFMFSGNSVLVYSVKNEI